MKRGETYSKRVPYLNNDDFEVLRHIGRHELTTADVWSHAPELSHLDRKSVGASVRRLVRLKLVERAPLFHGRFYFALSPSGRAAASNSQAKPAEFSEGRKVQLYARLLLTCIHRKELTPVSAVLFARYFEQQWQPLAGRVLAVRDRDDSMAFMRVDAHIASRPTRAAQVLRSDILRLAKSNVIAAKMKTQRFEYIFITATKPRADAVIAHFRKYAKVGRSPITVILLPQLIPLLAATPLNREINTPLSNNS